MGADIAKYRMCEMGCRGVTSAETFCRVSVFVFFQQRDCCFCVTILGGWGGVRTVRLLFPGYFLLLSVADRPPISTLVAQQDPRRPILEEFNFGNRLVTYASLKTKNMFCYRGYRKEESVSSTAEN